MPVTWEVAWLDRTAMETGVVVRCRMRRSGIGLLDVRCYGGSGEALVILRGRGERMKDQGRGLDDEWIVIAGRGE